MKIERLFDHVERAVSLIGLLVGLVLAAIGGWLGWTVCGALELGVLMQLGGAAIGAFMTCGLGWITWTLMKLFA